MNWTGPDVFEWLASPSFLAGAPYWVLLCIAVALLIGGLRVFTSGRATRRDHLTSQGVQNEITQDLGGATTNTPFTANLAVLPNLTSTNEIPLTAQYSGVVPSEAAPVIGAEMTAMPAGYSGFRRLDHGGFADVYYATDSGNRPVAIKMLRYSPDPNHKRLFIREVELLQKLQDAVFAPTLYDFDLEAHDPYLAMEYIDGLTLGQTVQKLGPITDPSRISQLMSETASALSEMHERGVIHRDIKPANTIMSAAGARIIDLGISRESVMYSTHTFGLGTVSYMPPEVAHGDAASTASDVYGWGAMMAYALTGRTIHGKGAKAELEVRIRSGRTDKAFLDALDAVGRLSAWHATIVRLVQNCTAENPLLRPEDGLNLRVSVAAHSAPVQSHGVDSILFSTKQPSLDRVLIRRQMNGIMQLLMRQRGLREPLNSEETLIAAVCGLLRMEPVNDLMRRGVAPSVLHGVLVAPYLTVEATPSGLEHYRSPRAWEDLGRRYEVGISSNRNGLLIFD
ncbi:serine/threonine protein kinase [Arthrobacter sp. R3-55]